MLQKRSTRISRPRLEPLEPRPVLSAVIAYPGALWPTNQIPYEIDPSVKDPADVVEAINEYNDETTVQWIPRTNQSAYVDFQYKDLGQLGEAGESLVGCLGSEQFIYLSDTATTATVLHEMGHSLGLFHEQSRADANQYIVIHSQNLLPGVTAATLEAPGPGGPWIRDVGPFDYHSIMMYNGYSSSANGQPTITYPDGTPVPYNTTLSAEDISTIDMHYPAPRGQAQLPGQVSAMAISPGKIKIAWTDTNAGQATYTVERAVAGQAFQTLESLAAGNTSYVDSQVSPGTLYQYVVVANTASDIPAVSQIVYAATSPDGPVLASSDSAGSVTLNWADSYAGQVAYVLDYSGTGSSSAPTSPIDLPVGSTSYTFPIGALDLAHVQYTFQVYAEAGEDPVLWKSDESNAVSAGTTSSYWPPQSNAPSVVGVVDVGHGSEKVTSVTIAFSEAMNARSVREFSLFHLFGGVLRRKRLVYSKKIKVGNVHYDDSNCTLTIRLATPCRGQVLVSLQGTARAADGVSTSIEFSAVVR
jgi:Astacin (Peptidase family M12A)